MRALWEECNHGAGNEAAAEVSFTDTDGDEIIFRRNANGKVEYTSNGDMLMEEVTNIVLGPVPEHEDRPDYTIRVDGVADGPDSWYVY